MICHSEAHVNERLELTRYAHGKINIAPGKLNKREFSLLKDIFLAGQKVNFTARLTLAREDIEISLDGFSAAPGKSATEESGFIHRV